MGKRGTASPKEVLPDLSEEALLWKQGSAFVFGVDEAGRGCLAGPVCAAVTCWAPFSAASGLPVEVRDSKRMTELQREGCYGPIQALALAHGVGFASVAEIDRWNILKANYLAVARALEAALVGLVLRGILQRASLEDPVSFPWSTLCAFLTDGNHPLVSQARFFVCSEEYRKEFPLLCGLYRSKFLERCIVKGDSRVFSIASASVLAKVSRDRLMVELDRAYPAYQFAIHKGYSTPMHIEKLRAVGPCIEHRRSFSPVSESLQLFSGE